jgi:hypothetical protein
MTDSEQIADLKRKLSAAEQQLADEIKAHKARVEELEGMMAGANGYMKIAVEHARQMSASAETAQRVLMGVRRVTG